jgi:hypothetical protein
LCRKMCAIGGAAAQTAEPNCSQQPQQSTRIPMWPIGKP